MIVRSRFLFAAMGRKRKELDLNTYAGLFAYRLRTLREAAGLSPEELADKIGVSRASIFSWESAQYCPSIDVLPKIAKALNTTPRMIIPDDILDE